VVAFFFARAGRPAGATGAGPRRRSGGRRRLTAAAGVGEH